MFLQDRKIISVIIATYNRYESLKNTLDSLLTQECDYSFSYEIIVVDNNSNDETKGITERYMRKFNKNLKYLFEPRQGKSYALNTGIKEAKGEIIAITDDDCIADKNWLKNIHNVFKSKNIDLMGGKTFPIFKNIKPEWLDIYTFRSALAYYNLGNDYIENDKRKILPIGLNMIAKKSSYKKFGGFLTESRGQDTEFSDRWIRLGAKIAYSPDVIVFHCIDSKRLVKSYYRKWYFLDGKNHSLIFKNKFTQGRRLFSVPLWVYKKLMLNIFKFIKGMLFFEKGTFSHEVLIWHKIGLILGLNGLKKTNFENLR